MPEVALFRAKQETENKTCRSKLSGETLLPVYLSAVVVAPVCHVPLPVYELLRNTGVSETPFNNPHILLLSCHTCPHVSQPHGYKADRVLNSWVA